jgi:lipoprotein-releasing system permease protein
MLFWRQEGRRVNRSAVLSVIGVAAGSAVLILSLSILNGFESEVWGALKRFEQQVVYRPVSSSADVQDAIGTLAKAGITGQRYAERKIVVQSEKGYRLVTARVVHNLQESKDKFGNAVQEELPYPPLHHRVMIGSVLADRLDLMPGDEVRLLSPLDISISNPNPPQYTVSVESVYEFGMLDFDEAYIFMDFETAAKIVPRINDYSGIAINDYDNYNEDAGRLLQPEQWGYSSWETDHANLLAAMKMEKVGSTIVLLLIILVASFNATSTMVMSVMEKYREIGILRSMGATRRFIKKVYLRQGMLIGIIGVVIGVGLGLAITLSHLQYQFIPGPEGIYSDEGLPMNLRWIDVLVVMIGAFIMTIGAAWYPARYATSILPAQAVNYEK